MPVFEHEGQSLYYELHGREGDPVVTIINGLSMRTSHWAPYFEQLPARGCRVLTYDMVGQGASSKPVLGADFDDHATMLAALHTHLGIDRPYVLGISFGGVVALKYAIRYPERTGGLIPVSTFSELDAQLEGHAVNLYQGLARVGFEFYLDLLMPLNFSNDYIEANRELLHVIKRVGASTNELYGIQNLMESLADFRSITPELERITAPTLILNAEFDCLTPRHLHDIMRRHIAPSRLVLVPRVCHAFTLEIPTLTSRLLAEFVQQVEAGQWQGDQSVWIAAEDPNAEPLLTYCDQDHLRAIPMPRSGSSDTKRQAGTRKQSAPDASKKKAAGAKKRSTADTPSKR
ncbi:alpha/beta hydrolase [Aquisalimonas lutea]|uniref:alpha/beta fold hydrolase n=1 Tax=Aquisalimonas lutea TaxID=1327750 RepID=UPI0025B3976E|nr:alpha/beta hydrolase [Aquisalimonas lutea]MDN3516682.1 alpha/beta hydrolase [Aquisalimonas lutea]